MALVVQIMMGVSLAACTGLRAWLPLLCVGLLARTGYLQLNPSFAFLTRDDLLIVCGVATVLEFLGDKIPAVDNLLDTAGTFVRPIAGSLLAASVVTGVDPLLATVIGIILGGGTSLTLHLGKAAVRAQSTATAPLHGGTANLALSLGEDFASLGGIGIAYWLPVLAFVIALAIAWLAVRAIRSAVRHGKKLLRRDPPPPPTDASS